MISADNPKLSTLPSVELSHPRLESSDAHALARATNLPLAYAARTRLLKAGDRIFAIVHRGDHKLDMDAVAHQLGGRVEELSAEEASRLAGMPADSVNPLSLSTCCEVIFDEKALRLPVLCLPGRDESHSVKVETRHIRRAGVRSARLAVPARTVPEGSAFDVLLERGFIDRVTDESLARKHMADKTAAVYAGFDPSAKSLHVGSLMPIMALAHVQRCGPRAIAVVGGATGLIGDPSGKTEARKLLSREDVSANMAGISRQLTSYLKLDGERGKLVDNASWFSTIGCLEFLRELGPHFSINQMIKSESIRLRLEREGEGLSFLELTYMLLQAYDFVRLASEERCLVQVGGSDQWGNICAGLELGRRASGKTLFGRRCEHTEELAGVTFMLLTKADGGKFGKTESGNVWLDEDLTSPYEFFQFWRNTDDADVERFLALFTFIPLEDIASLCANASGSALNLAKEVLAFSTTALAHGKEKAFAAVSSAKALFGGYDASFAEVVTKLGLASEEELKQHLHKGGAPEAGPPRKRVRSEELASGTYTVSAALVELGLASSKSESRRLIQQGGVQVDGERIESISAVLRPAKAGESITIRVGKKKYGVLEVE